MEAKWIKNTELLIKSVDELINACGTSKEIAESIDEMLLDYFEYLCKSGDCPNESHAVLIYRIRSVRDLFSKLDNE